MSSFIDFKSDLLKSLKEDLPEANFFYDELEDGEGLFVEAGGDRICIPLDMIKSAYDFGLSLDIPSDNSIEILCNSIVDTIRVGRPEVIRAPKDLSGKFNMVIVDKDNPVARGSHFVDFVDGLVGIPFSYSIDTDGVCDIYFLSDSNELDEDNPLNVNEVLNDMLLADGYNLPELHLEEVDFTPDQNNPFKVYGVGPLPSGILPSFHYVLRDDFYGNVVGVIGSDEFYLVVIGGVNFVIIPGEESEEGTFSSMCLLSTAANGTTNPRFFDINDVFHYGKNGEIKRVSKNGMVL